MRTPQDRAEVVKLYADVFKLSEIPPVDRRPSYHIDPYYLQVGSAHLPRRKHVALKETPELHQVLHANLQPLETLIRCVQHNWMAILVGPTSSGKTSLVHLLADISGNTLRTFAVNSSITPHTMTFTSVTRSTESSKKKFFFSRWPHTDKSHFFSVYHVVYGDNSELYLDFLLSVLLLGVEYENMCLTMFTVRM